MNKITIQTILVAIVLLFNSTMTTASNDTGKKVYVYQDQKGNTVFTDQAKPGAKLVDMTHNTLTMPATDTRIVTQVEEQSTTPQYRVTINSPKQKQTIRDNQGIVEIYGAVTPSKVSFNHEFRLKLDGKIIQKPHANAHFVLRDVDRGEHTIVLELINDNQQVIASSTAVTFYLFRTSILHNRSQN